jgi:CspA family cold shock protein
MPSKSAALSSETSNKMNKNKNENELTDEENDVDNTKKETEEEEEVKLNNAEIQNSSVVNKECKGQVKWFDYKKGYGFIEKHKENSDETTGDIFVYYTQIKSNSDFKLLYPGEYVIFEEVECPKKGMGSIQAHNVRAPYNGKLMHEFKNERDMLNNVRKQNMYSDNPTSYNPVIYNIKTELDKVLDNFSSSMSGYGKGKSNMNQNFGINKSYNNKGNGFYSNNKGTGKNNNSFSYFKGKGKQK